jgi:uncharacterized lipoprotein YajG
MFMRHEILMREFVLLAFVLLLMGCTTNASRRYTPPAAVAVSDGTPAVGRVTVTDQRKEYIGWPR